LRSQFFLAITHFYKLGLLRLIVATILISMYGCNGSKSLQNTLAPDPKLDRPDATDQKVVDSPTKPNDSLPAEFPLYPQAKLQSTEQSKEQGIVTTWTTSDPIDFVYKFYQTELPAKQWQIVTQPSDSEPQLVAKQQETSVAIVPQSSTDKQQTGVTTYTISLLTATNSPTPTPTASEPIPTTSPTTSPTPKIKPSSSPPSATADYLTDLTQLSVFTSADTAAKNKTPATNRVVTRREYARWLVTAYNRIASSKPTQQLKPATTDAKPIFRDVPTTHPDFPSIQGLAEAGLIPSPLSGDATMVTFRPDAPLTREQMILWKLQLDTHQPLPAASLDAVKQTWGFQDAGKIEPKALRAVLADFQNGEQSNIRRVFGYTTLFQPQKTVNLGEVAITIWYFGANSEGLSARDALQAE
jgi:S-layer homology domain